MARKSVPPSGVLAWLRLTLAAFVFAVYAAIALATGVAHADEGSSGAAGAHDSAKSAAFQSSTGSTTSTTSGTTKPSDTSPPAEGADAGRTDTTETVATDTDGSGADESAVNSARKASKRHLTIVDAPVPRSTPSSAAPTATTPKATTPTATTSTATTPTASTAAQESATPQASRSARIATPTVAVTTSTGTVPPAIVPRLDRQFAGLVADVGTITVSAVHTVASAVAQAFGPASFLGVPYLLATTVANAAAAVGGSLVGAPQFAPVAGRFPVTYGILDGLAFLDPTKPPAGANDPTIHVTAAHPLPIILLNGTTATQGANWSVGAPVLANAGYKVYTFNYGNTTADPNFPIQAIADIKQSGLELSKKVDEVLKETKAPKVILIGHSQGGGILPEYYINDLGGAAKVSQLIGISPSNHGTDLDGLVYLQAIPILGPLVVGLVNAIAPAGYQQAVGSPFQQEVYGKGDTRPGVLYTTIASVNDEVVTPYTQQALTGPNVTNIVIQDRYPGVVIGHANVFTSPQAMALMLEALASNPAANPHPNPLTRPDVVAA